MIILGTWKWTPSKYDKLLIAFWVQLWGYPQFFWISMPIQIAIPLFFTCFLAGGSTIIAIVDAFDRTHGTFERIQYDA